MRRNKPAFHMAAALALAIALVSGILFFADNPVYAADPTWDANTSTRSVDENTPPGVNVGDPISATDADETGTNAIEFGNTLTYKLGGTDAASFDIDSSTGQLITKAPLDADGDKTSYSVTVTVDDGETRNNPIRQDVTISVTDLDEPPAAPFAPVVVSGKDETPDNTTEESTTSLHVVWHPPVNTGPAITGYTVQYKKSVDTAYTTLSDGQSGTQPYASISPDPGLEPDTSYHVRVQATNDEGTGPWSYVGTGKTNRKGNKPPSFNEEESKVDLDVDENTPAGEKVDSPVTATDADTTTLTYALGGPHADLFNFNTRSGQIQTKAPLNHEDPRCGYDNSASTTKCVYRVTVTVVDMAGGSAATRVDIEVDDETEAPSAPARPTVRATANSSTSLSVSWKAPDNDGPPITGYVVQYRKGVDSFTANGVVVTDATATISGNDGNNNPWLAPNTTYEVRVRAQNGERDSAWSRTGTGRTSAANQQPIFDDRPGTGTGSDRGSAFFISRTMNENPGSSHVVGRVVADDPDNDKLTYKLVQSADSNDARDELSKFTINETNGEIRTKPGETYNYEAITGANTCDDNNDNRVDGLGSDDVCYTVKVEVRDGLDDNRAEAKDEAADDVITLKIGLRDRDEPPSVPKVTVTSPAKEDDEYKLKVFWHAENTGPVITKYDVQYRKGGGTFLDDNCNNETAENNCTGLDDNSNDNDANALTNTTIRGLDENTSYSVRVRAKNSEGTSSWSTVTTLKTNKGDNTTPTFVDTTDDQRTRNVNENTASSQNVGSAVNASDDNSNILTYSLGGRDAGLFTIVSSTGQIRTRAALNHEDPACGYVSTADTTACTYTVRVKADDKAGGSVSIEVTIKVVDVNEPPAAPSVPRVTATKGTGQSLDVTWNAPSNTGKPPIADYDVQYRKFKTADTDDWKLWPHGGDGTGAITDGNTTTSTTITRRLPAENAAPLEPSTQYEVRVRAKNGEKNDANNWSTAAKATTGKSNSRPVFDRAGAIELSVSENTRSGQNIGSAVSASDADSNNLTYTLEGPGAGSFNIVSSSGQIRTKSPLDFETRDSYSLTVKVDDGQKRSNSVAAKSVTITVDDVREPPSTPAAPTVTGVPGSTSSIRVTWARPANTGTSVDRYDVHYRQAGVGAGPTRWEHFGADRSTIITGLNAGTRYEVQVRAHSDEGLSAWSSWGSGSPNPDTANRNPAFAAGTRTLSVAENTLPNTDVGAAIAATDPDGDTLTYTLEGADADSFDILSTTDGGQIRTSASLNYEAKSRYSVTVRVGDGRGGSDAVNVTINVTDVDGEAPGTPDAPAVRTVSSSTLQVSWDAPSNQGPPITDYDYRYREPAGNWTAVTNTAITGTTVEITGLGASTSYDVEVRAKNAEGTGEWSNPGIGSTNAAGANNPPVFNEGVKASRSVAASAAAGTNIGAPVKATDADPGEVISYRLEGSDAKSFAINAATGQLETKSGVTLVANQKYTVTVVADDGADTARITVTITATSTAPNPAPTFPATETGARSVTEGAAAGTNIGAPVAAQDPGDTLTYTLGGTDAASFAIVASTGQLRTRAALDASTKSTYTVTVTATDTAGGTAEITVTITVTTSTLGQLGDQYDANSNGVIERSEVITAIRDYFADEISRDDVIAIIRLYFSG